MVLEGITPEDRKEIDRHLEAEAKGIQLTQVIVLDGGKEVEIPDLGPFSHFGFGRMIRNNWNFWIDSPISRWFVETLQISHADDMWGILEDAIKHKLRGLPFDPHEAAKFYHKHWRKTYKRQDAPEWMVKQWWENMAKKIREGEEE